MYSPIRGKKEMKYSEIQLDKASKKIWAKLKKEKPIKIEEGATLNLLCRYDLIEEAPDETPDTYVISQFGKSYAEYLKDDAIRILLQSIVAPIFVTLVTNLLIHYFA